MFDINLPKQFTKNEIKPYECFDVRNIQSGDVIFAYYSLDNHFDMDSVRQIHKHLVESFPDNKVYSLLMPDMFVDPMDKRDAEESLWNYLKDLYPDEQDYRDAIMRELNRISEDLHG